MRRTPGLPGLSPLEFRNDRLLAVDGSQSRLFAPDGTDVLREDDQKMLLRWLDDNLLAYLPGLQGHRPDDRTSSDFATISAQDGSHTLTMPVGRSSQCAYTGDRLACADEEATRIGDISR